jgi:GTP pyrophosphokinase
MTRVGQGSSAKSQALARYTFLMALISSSHTRLADAVEGAERIGDSAEPPSPKARRDVGWKRTGIELERLLEHLDPVDATLVRRASSFAATLYGTGKLPSGELLIDHAHGILAVLDAVRADAPARAAGVLFGAAELLAKPAEQLGESFGEDIAAIVDGVRELTRLGELTRRQSSESPARDAKALERQVETLRKMLLAFATDIRVVLVRLASRLQTLRYYAATKQEVPEAIARESLEIYAPLANRLGVWQIKWEIEDLALRFLEPDAYKRIARMLDEKRVEREAFISATMLELSSVLSAAGIEAEISGRPKHIFSIINKMRTKGLDFADLYDVRALRVIVEDERECYAALGVIHGRWPALPEEFDDYIARPKSNGYMSLHTVVRDAAERPFEVQIRTRAMHRFAEFGVAAHWRYKEGGTGTGARNRYDEKIAWLRQLLAWKAEVSEAVSQDAEAGESHVLKQTIAPAKLLDDRIFVLTPHARVIELPTGSTPVDFAYHLHTEIGHRCRGARVDGALVPLNTPLKSGQTVEIVLAKAGTPGFGPSRDWLNAQLGFLHSPRARAKVRQWFNALELDATLAAGRALIEKTLQREGKTAVNLEDLALKLGFSKADELFVAAAKDEFSLRNVELALHDNPAETISEPDALALTRPSRSISSKSSVLVVGVDALMTQLAKCCKPAPPDLIVGFVTRGKGVSIHRHDCSNFTTMRERNPERVIDCDWGVRGEALYPVDVEVIAQDRQGLLRDISEVFSRERINVIGVNTESRKGSARMRFTAEVRDAMQLARAVDLIGDVAGVEKARRA